MQRSNYFQKIINNLMVMEQFFPLNICIVGPNDFKAYVDRT